MSGEPLGCAPAAVVFASGQRWAASTRAGVVQAPACRRLTYTVAFTTAFINGLVHPADANWLLAAARRVGLLRRPAVGAVHTLLVETPTGQQRTFRWAAAGSCLGRVLQASRVVA